MPWVGGSTAASATNGGKIYAYNNISEAGVVVVAPKNTSRRTITFHNPGAHLVYIAPSIHQTTGLDTTLAPSNVALGGSFGIPPASSIILTGECHGEWKAFAATGAGIQNPLTVMDSNV